MQPDEYLTLASSSQAAIKVKGSKFIGHAAPVETKTAAENFIATISKQYHDASHNCFAYRIGLGDEIIFRYSDEREPSGTAGAPIYKVIESRELSNVAIVITRYFGGTKLGKGGLIRAYTECTQQTLAQASFIKKYTNITLILIFDYNLSGSITRTMSRFGVKVLESSYGNDVKLKIQIPKSLDQAFKKAVQDATSGKAQILQ